MAAYVLRRHRSCASTAGAASPRRGRGQHGAPRCSAPPVPPAPRRVPSNGLTHRCCPDSPAPALRWQVITEGVSRRRRPYVRSGITMTPPPRRGLSPPGSGLGTAASRRGKAGSRGGTAPVNERAVRRVFTRTASAKRIPGNVGQPASLCEDKRDRVEPGEAGKRAPCEEKALGSAWPSGSGEDAFWGHSC